MKERIPDGYIFNAQRRRLYLFEVVATHAIDARKLGKLHIIRDLLEALGWTLRVAVSTTDGKFRRMDWATGQPSLSERETEQAIGRMGIS